MAKSSTTFKGAPKPYGATGHFDEPRRHALQAKGIKTGHLSDKAVYEQYGITNLEKGSSSLKDMPKTSQGLEDIQAEAIEEKEAQPKKESLSEKFRRAEKSFVESRERERALKAQHRREKAYLELGKELPEPKPKEREEEEESEEEYDSESLPAKLGTFLADLDNDYTSEDLVGLNDKELEMLAVRFKSETKDNISLFGDPENPFLSELKRRIEARDELAKEKAQLRAELRHPKKEKSFIEELTED
jgi:hypothetical protein